MPFFLLTFDWVVSNERRTVCAGKCHSSPGGTPLYKPYRYVPPQRVGFLRRFGLKTGIDFPHFGPESKIGYGFPGNFESVRKYLLFQFQMSSKEREICQFEMAFKKSFLLLQGHPMDLFLKISVLHANFLLAGRCGRNNSPWKESVAGKKNNSGCQRGFEV